MKKISRLLQANMLLRSLFVQSCWNFEKLQNLGFALIIYPAAGAAGRHLDYFNTHPYFAGLVAAAVAAEEGGPFDEGRFLDDLKRSLMSTLGSVGDGFFWAALRPLAALLAVLPALYGLLWAPLVLLIGYNVIHLSVRWWGIGAGLAYGCHVIRLLEKLPLLRLKSLLATLGALAAGVAAGVAAVHPSWRPLPSSPALSVFAGLFVFLVSMAVAQGGAERT
jgi:PTS system mannose-specific IID component